MFARICIDSRSFVCELWHDLLTFIIVIQSSVRVKSHTHDPVQVLDEAKDSITSIHLSKHEILIVYVYNNSLIVSFSTCSCWRSYGREAEIWHPFWQLYTDTIGRMCSTHTLTCWKHTYNGKHLVMHVVSNFKTPAAHLHPLDLDIHFCTHADPITSVKWLSRWSLPVSVCH